MNAANQQLRTAATAAPGSMTSREIIDAPVIAPGFGSLQSFELLQRTARVLSNSSLVPAAYRAVIEKTNRYGEVTESRENPNALPNAIVALNMAQRMGADPLMVMQNLYIVEGRPSWSSQWIIAAINGCGRFSPLRFEITDLGEKTVDCMTFVWEDGANGKRNRVERKVTYKIRDKKCIAWAVEKETGARIESPTITIEMAVKEGWYGKAGSKWQTMDEVMLRYRAASFFGKLYAPEILMGLVTVEESEEMITLERQDDGSYAPADQTPATPSSSMQRLSEAAKGKQPDPSQQLQHQPAPERIPQQTRQAQPEPVRQRQADTPPAAEAGQWEPSPAELAEIEARERAEAGGLFGDQPQTTQPAPTGRRPRGALNVE